MAGLASGALLAPIAPLGAGCGGRREERTLGPYVVAITKETPAAFTADDASIFQVGTSIALPLRDRPSGLPRQAPYPGGVWITPERLRVQASYVISNLEDEELKVGILFDAWNEFVWYSPQIRVVDDDVIPDRSTVDRLVILPPRARVQGRVAYDDFERVALALATIVGGAPNPFHVLDPQTQIRLSPLSAPYVPAVISGLTGFDVSLRTTRAARVAVEVVVELLDLDEILVELGDPSRNQRRSDQGRRPLVPAIAAAPTPA
jgi:hypothetical protein